MVTSVLLVGSRDRQLEELLRSIAGQVTVTSDSDLMRLTAGAKMPQVIVLDARGDTSVPASCASFRRQHPEVGIVIAAATLDPTLLVEAMRAGVNEVVAEPFTEESVAEAVARVT